MTTNQNEQQTIDTQTPFTQKSQSMGYDVDLKIVQEQNIMGQFNNPSRCNMINMMLLTEKYTHQQLDILRTKDLYDLYQYDRFVASGKKGIILNNDELNIIKKYIYHTAKNQRLQMNISNNCIYLYLTPTIIMMIDVQALKFPEQSIKTSMNCNYQIEKRALLLLFEGQKFDVQQNKTILFEELYKAPGFQREELKINIYNGNKEDKFYLLLSKADYQQKMFEHYEKQYLGWFIVIYTKAEEKKTQATKGPINIPDRKTVLE